MKKRLILIGIFLALLATPVMADLQGVLDGITLAPNPGASSVNVATDKITDGADAYWAISATGGSVATVIIELAAFAPTNTFGVFDRANPASMVQVFGGAAVAGDQAVLSIKADGSVFVNFVDSGVNFAGNNFGYYLDASVGSADPAAVFKSDTTLNADLYDHMYAVQGKGIDTVQLPGLAPGKWNVDEHVFGWEDVVGGGDGDHDDFVVMVESVQPIPEPATIGILGLGALTLLRKRRA